MIDDEDLNIEWCNCGSSSCYALRVERAREKRAQKHDDADPFFDDILAEDAAIRRLQQQAKSERQWKTVSTISDNLLRATRRIAKAERELVHADPLTKFLIRSDLIRLQGKLQVMIDSI